MADENQVTGKIVVETQEAQAALAQFVAALQQTTAQMNQGFKAMENSTKQSSQQMQESMKSAGKGITDAVKDMHGQVKGSIESVIATVTKIGTAFVAVGAVLAGGAMFKSLIQDTVDYVSEAKKLSQTLGVNINDAAAYNQAYKRVGITHNELEGVLKRFQTQVRMNSEMLRDKYGIDIDAIRAKGGGLTEMFEKAKDVLRGYTEGFDRNMAAQEIFGRRVEDVNKLLRVNSDSVANAKKFLESLGLTIGPEMEAQIRKFKAGLADMDTILLALKFVIAQQVIPALMKLQDWFTGEGGQAVRNFTTAVNALASAFGALQTSFQWIYDSLNVWEKWNKAAQSTQKLINLAKGIPLYSGDMGAGSHGGDWGMPEPEKPKGTKEWSPTDKGGKGGEGSIVQQWQNELDQKKLMEKAFQDQSLELEKAFRTKMLALGRKATKEEEEGLKAAQKEAAVARLQAEQGEWQTKLALCTAGTKEYNEVQHKIVALELQINKARLQGEVDLIKSKEAANIASLKDKEALIEHERKLEQIDIQMKQQNLKHEATMGTISKTAELQGYRKLLDEKHKADLKAEQIVLAGYKKGEADYKAHERKMEQTAKERIFEVNKANDAVAEAQASTWGQVFSGITSSFGTAIQSMMQAGANFASVMASLGQSILNVFVSAITTIVEKWLLGFVTKLIGAVSANVAEIMSMAPVAGAAAYVSAMIAVPFPFNMAVAPAAAAIATSAVMAMAPMAMAEGGWWQVPRATITQLHPEEMVLPAWAAVGLRDKVIGDGSGAGGGVTNVSAPISITINPRQEMTQRDYDRHSRMIVKSLNKAIGNHGQKLGGGKY